MKALLEALEISAESGFGLCRNCDVPFRCGQDLRCLCPTCGHPMQSSDAWARLDERITRGWTDEKLVDVLLGISEESSVRPGSAEDALMMERAGYVQLGRVWEVGSGIGASLAAVLTPKGVRVANALARVRKRHMAQQLDFLRDLAAEASGSGFWTHVRTPDWLCDHGFVAPVRTHVWSITDKGREEVKKRWPQG